jgi:hypothetical protein
VPHYLFNFGEEFSADIIEAEYKLNAQEFNETYVLDILQSGVSQADKFHQLKYYIDELSKKETNEELVGIIEKYYKKCQKFKAQGFTRLFFHCERED